MLQETRRYVMRPAGNDRTGAIAKSVQARFVFALMDLSDSEATPAVKAQVDAMLRTLQADLQRRNSGHGLWLVSKIEAHLNQPAVPAAPITKAKTLPPGGPIGMDSLETCWHC